MGSRRETLMSDGVFTPARLVDVQGEPYKRKYSHTRRFVDFSFTA